MWRRARSLILHQLPAARLDIFSGHDELQAARPGAAWY
jgi:hypothetical protein